MATSKILVIDDERSIQRICSLYLEAEGFAVKAMSEADNVVHLASQDQPDVIIMDLNLPGVDGFTATRALKDVAETSSIPVLVISARSEAADKRMALVSCSADDYLTKPFDPDELVARVTVLCRRRQQELCELRDRLEEQLRDIRSEVGKSVTCCEKIDDFVIDLIDREFGEPLRSIEAAAGRLAQSMPGDKDPGHILDSATQLRGLVDKLVELRDFRKGNRRERIEPISLCSLLEPLAARFSEEAEQRDFEFQYECNDEAVQLKTSPDRLRRVVSLLLQHEINGGATSLSLEAGADDEMIECAVRSNRLDATSGPLELPLARHIAEQLGGELHTGPTESGERLYRVVLPRKAPAESGIREAV